MCVHFSLCVYAHAAVRRQLVKLGARDRTQVLRVGGKYLYLLSQTAGPILTLT